MTDRPTNAAFQTTSWSLVVAAAADPTIDSGKALSALCEIYWSPVYAFVRRRGYDQDQALDLTQGFFALLLEKGYLGDADWQRGKFRAFLQTAVKRFLANEWDRAHALKRGGHRAPLSIDSMDVEVWYAPQVTEHRTPGDLFDRRWALAVLEHAMARLREEFSAKERQEQFEKLSMFLDGDPHGTSYEAVGAELGSSPGAIRVAVHRLRRRFRELLREEIAATVSGTEEIDEEIRFLISTLNNRP